MTLNRYDKVMIKLLLITFILFALGSCMTQKETKDATFWRRKYEALEYFVKRKGLDAEAEQAVKQYEESRALYSFRVFKDGYALNGQSLAADTLDWAIKNMKGPKNQLIDIKAMPDVNYEDILHLMNELNLNGFKNYNLTSEKKSSE